MFAARGHLADEQEALSLSAFSLNTHNSWSTDTCDQKIDQLYFEHPPALMVAGDRWLRSVFIIYYLYINDIFTE